MRKMCLNRFVNWRILQIVNVREQNKDDYVENAVIERNDNTPVKMHSNIIIIAVDHNHPKNTDLGNTHSISI